MEPKYRPLGRSALVACVVWGFLALVNIYLAIAAYAPYAVLTRSPGWRTVAPSAVREGGLGIEGLVGLVRDLSRAEVLLTPVYLLGTALLVAFLYRAHRNLPALGAPTRYASHWAITGWLIPILNFVRPFQFVRELRRASVEAAGAAAPARTPSPLPRLWWETWMLAVVAALPAYLIRRRGALEWTGALVALSLIRAIGALLTIALIRDLARLQTARRAGETPLPVSMSFPPAIDAVALALIVGTVWWTHDVSGRRISETLMEMRAARDARQRADAIRGVPPPPDTGALSPKPETAATREFPVVAHEQQVPGAVPGVAGGVVGGVLGGVPGGVPGGVSGGVIEMPPPEQRKGPLRVGGDVQAPVLISAPVPVYPELARRARIRGFVIVEAVVDRNGGVTDAKIIKPLPFLDQAALEVVRRSKYAPATLHGRPVPVYFVVTVRFGL